jgi:hypothetical protein
VTREREGQLEGGYGESGTGFKFKIIHKINQASSAGICMRSLLCKNRRGSTARGCFENNIETVTKLTILLETTAYIAAYNEQALRTTSENILAKLWLKNLRPGSANFVGTSRTKCHVQVSSVSVFLYKGRFRI